MKTRTVGLPRWASEDTGRSSSESNAYEVDLSKEGSGAPPFVETPTGPSVAFGPQADASTTRPHATARRAAARRPVVDVDVGSLEEGPRARHTVQSLPF